MPDATGHAERFISVAGGFIGILLTMWISLHFTGQQGAALLVASMGSSAVLLFAVPHSTFAQPWPVLGGHVSCALIGVICAQTVPIPLLAAPLSVALSIAAMRYMRCLHPPAGGTALVPVIGGTELHALGYQFVLTPVLLNSATLLLAAVVVNNAFSWQCYPARFRQKSNAGAGTVQGKDATGQLSLGDFEYAKGEMGSYLDISEGDLAKLYVLANKHARRVSDEPEQVIAGHFYSNGALGIQWSVAKVIALLGDSQSKDAVVTFEIVAGDKQFATGSSTMVDFSGRHKYEVELKNGSWHRLKQDRFVP